MAKVKTMKQNAKCQKCGTRAEVLFRYKGQYICDVCLNPKYDLPKLEDLVTARKPLDSYMPGSVGGGVVHHVQKQVRKHGEKSRFQPVPYQHRVAGR